MPLKKGDIVVPTITARNKYASQATVVADDDPLTMIIQFKNFSGNGSSQRRVPKHEWRFLRAGTPIKSVINLGTGVVGDQQQPLDPLPPS